MIKALILASLLVLTQSAAAPRFDVASVKLTPQPPEGTVTGGFRILPGGRLSTAAATAKFLIQRAYGVRPDQIVGAPAWTETEHYDIEAKGEENATQNQILSMMQTLLADRFKLSIRREIRELSVLELTIPKAFKLALPREGSCIAVDPAKPGMGMPPKASGGGPPVPCGRVSATIGPKSFLVGGNISMANLVYTLSNVLGKTIIDRTGHSEAFDINLTFANDDALAVRNPAPNPAAPVVAPEPAASIFTALQEQAGLKLAAGRGPVEVIVVDHIEKPSAKPGF